MEGPTMDVAVDANDSNVINVSELQWETAKGHKLQVIKTNPYGFLKFQWVGGGPLPKQLSGDYTNERDMRAAGDKYIAFKVEDQTRGMDILKNAKKSKSKSI
tara:strand:+ start:230 stop:535 length:306 start_codon:yes stop_codon:yes gene_type:complete